MRVSDELDGVYREFNVHNIQDLPTHTTVHIWCSNRFPGIIHHKKWACLPITREETFWCRYANAGRQAQVEKGDNAYITKVWSVTGSFLIHKKVLSVSTGLHHVTSFLPLPCPIRVEDRLRKGWKDIKKEIETKHVNTYVTANNLLLEH